MLIFTAQNFVGAVLEIHPKRLPDGFGVEARNMRLGSADLRPYNAANVCYTIAGTTTQRTTLYRLGRATASDTQFWLSWVEDVDVVRSLLASDPTERIYYTGQSEPRVTDNIMALAGEPYPTAYRTLGVVAPLTAMLAALNTAGTGLDETRIYLDTFVTDRGEESAPNPATARIVVKGASTVNLSALSAVPSGSTGITLRRIYVSAGNDFQLCVELDATLTTATDTGYRSQILASGGSTSRPAWLPPPSGLRGLTELWNGMLGAFVGKSLRVCEAYKPYAWPIEYENIVPDDIVGTGKFLQKWVVLTTGAPRLFMGSSPLAMSEVPTAFKQSCIAKRSIASLDAGVVWASKKGLCYITSAGSLGQGHGESIVTDGIFTREQWAAMNPATMQGCRFDEKTYICFYIESGGGRRAFLIEPHSPKGVIFLDQGAFGSYHDPISDQLFLLDTGGQVRKWHSGTPLTLTFRSGIIRNERECNPGVLKIEADTYPVAFKLWGDGVLRASVSVASNAPLRLPSGYMAQEFQYEISATGPVQIALLGESVADLLIQPPQPQQS